MTTRLLIVDADMSIAHLVTAIEFGTLASLIRATKNVLTRHVLIDQVCRVNDIGDEHVVHVHLASLRHKLGSEPAGPDFIGAVRTVGHPVRAAS
jgi:DNA-binding response OmpR family regulator